MVQVFFLWSAGKNMYVCLKPSPKNIVLPPSCASDLSWIIPLYHTYKVKRRETSSIKHQTMTRISLDLSEIWLIIIPLRNSDLFLPIGSMYDIFTYMKTIKINQMYGWIYKSSHGSYGFPSPVGTKIHQDPSDPDPDPKHQRFRVFETLSPVMLRTHTQFWGNFLDLLPPTHPRMVPAPASWQRSPGLRLRFPDPKNGVSRHPGGDVTGILGPAG